NQDWNGRFVVQNMSDIVTACVTIVYLSHESDSAVAWEPYNPADAGSGTRYAECPNGGMPLQPRGSILKHPDNMAVEAPFRGAVRIDLHTNAAGVPPSGQFVSATADTWNLNRAPFGSYRAFTQADLGHQVILPLIDREVGPSASYSTRFYIVNQDPSKPAVVGVEFRGYDVESDTPDALIVKTHQFEVRASRLCVQDADDASNCLAEGDSLPPGFVGTVRLLSSEPIAVVVHR